MILSNWNELDILTQRIELRVTNRKAESSARNS